MSTVFAMFFSPTRGSAKLACAVADSLAQHSDALRQDIDITAPSMRQRDYSFAANDIVIFAFPVYGGRMPLPLDGVLSRLCGAQAYAVPLAVYGNRAFEDALLEGADRLSAQGFRVVAGGAFIAEHSYSEKVGAYRPDRFDTADAAAFGAKIARKLASGMVDCPTLPGNRPYKERQPASPVAPLTKPICNGCGLCARRCPMGIISEGCPSQVASGCIHCCACVKCCTLHAKYFEDERMKQVKSFLEANCTDSKAPETFI